MNFSSFKLGTVVLTLFLSTFVNLAHASTLKVATFNTWGVPMVVWDTFRYRAAMTELEKMEPDLIVLQEVFSGKGRRGFESDLYPYVAKGPGMFPRLASSGLRILSKHPILKVATMVYRSCAKDDCLSRKGALLTVIELPGKKHLNLITTHLNARGKDTTRINQLLQLKEFIQYYADSSAPIMIAGDFNFNSATTEYAFLTEKLKEMSPVPISDLWAATHAPSEPGYTSDAFENTYAHDYSLRTNFPLTRERIDYQFSNLTPIASHLIFNQKPFYSDHYGLVGEYQLPE